MNGILLLGLGNILQGDDGAGVRALEAFESKYAPVQGVETLDGGTSGLELLDHIVGRRHLIVLDAVRAGRPPGTIVRLEGAEVPAFLRTKVSPHQVGLADVLAAALLAGGAPADIVLIGVEPQRLETAIELSPTVAGAVQRMADMAAGEIRAIGITLEER